MTLTLQDLLSVTALVAIVQFLAAKLVEKRIEGSIRHDYDKKLEQFRFEMRRREQASRVAKLLAMRFRQPASANQLDAIEGITHQRPVGLNRREASEMLDRAFTDPPASNRQIMFLRFWNRTDLATKSRREISAWMDSFIQADQARWLAWGLFKDECEDDGSQRDPSFVPIGAGEKYLKKVYQEFQ